MEPHLAHRLPWTSLANVIIATRPNPSAKWNVSRKPTEKQLQVVLHFARCLVGAVQEFATTDKSSEDERSGIDPKRWGLYAWHPAWGDLGYYDSVLMGYVQLNLLLTDATAFEPLLLSSNRRRNSTMDAMCDDNDGGHDADLAAHLQQAFDGNRMKPLTVDVRQVLRDHAAALFRCMYSLLPVNGGVLNVNVVAMRLVGLGWWRHVCLTCATRDGTGFVLRDGRGRCSTCSGS